jgi:hypothetical protein
VLEVEELTATIGATRNSSRLVTSLNRLSA